jgi:hypothetical protein
MLVTGMVPPSLVRFGGRSRRIDKSGQPKPSQAKDRTRLAAHFIRPGLNR